jgi:hypothetical protein
MATIVAREIFCCSSLASVQARNANASCKLMRHHTRHAHEEKEHVRCLVAVEGRGQLKHHYRHTRKCFHASSQQELHPYPRKHDITPTECSWVEVRRPKIAAVKSELTHSTRSPRRMTMTMMMNSGRGKPLTKKRARKPRRTICSVPGCVKISQMGGVCCEHGARTSRSTCSFPRCSNISQRGGLCRRHGSDRLRICTVEDCPKMGRYCDVHSGIIPPTRDSADNETRTMRATEPIPPPAAAADVVVPAASTSPTQGGHVSPPSSETSDVGFPPPLSFPRRPPSSSVEKEFYTKVAQVIGFTNDMHDNSFAPPRRSPSVGVSFPQVDCSHGVRINTNPIVIVGDKFYKKVVAAQAQAVAQQQHHHHLQTSSQETNTIDPQEQGRSGAFTTTTLGEIVSAFSVEAQVAEKYDETHNSGKEFDVSSRAVAVGGSMPNKPSNASSWVIPAVIPTTAATSHEQGHNTKNAGRLVQLAIPSIDSDEINEHNLRTARILHAARMAVIRAATNNVASRLSATTTTTTTHHPSPLEQGQGQYYPQANDDTVFHSPSSAPRSVVHYAM